MVARLRFHRQRSRRRALAAAPRVPKRCRPAWSYQARRRQRRRVLRCRQASEAAADKALSRAQALQALACPSAEVRRAGTERLGEIGKMADADNLLARLHDDNEQVRLFAAAALWRVWSRSGGPRH